MGNRILHGFWPESGTYDVGPSGDGVNLTKEQLAQLVFEASKELGIFDFKCRDCEAWAAFAVRWRPQSPEIFLCTNHVTDEHHQDFGSVRKLYH